MDQTGDIPNPAQVVRIIHAALVAGVLFTGAAFVFVVHARESMPESGEMHGILLAVIGLALALVSAPVLRRRIPERTAQQSPDGYWGIVENRSAAMILWAVIEGAALASLVGYFLTGSLVPVITAVIALAALILFRPSRLEASGLTNIYSRK
jgi:hypothetical protein